MSKMTIMVMGADGNLSPALLTQALQGMSDSLETIGNQVSTLAARVDAGDNQHNDNVAKITTLSTDVEVLAADVQGVLNVAKEVGAGNVQGTIDAGEGLLPAVIETMHRAEAVFKKVFGVGASVRMTPVPPMPDVPAAIDATKTE